MDCTFFPWSLICHNLTWRDGFLQIFDLWSNKLWITKRSLTLLDEVSEGQDREIEWPKGALVSTKWRTSCRLSKIYGSYNALLSQWSNQARILIQIVIYRCINKLAVYYELINCFDFCFFREFSIVLSVNT